MVAVEINPQVVEGARRNVIRNGVADRVDVRHSDVFSAVDGAFDLVIFDPPFRWFAARDLLEMAITDEDYRALITFVRNADRHLCADGGMLIFFGTSGDLGYLRQLSPRRASQPRWWGTGSWSRTRCGWTTTPIG